MSFEILNPSVCLERLSREVILLWIDSPGKSVNVIDAEMLTGLEMAIERLGELSNELEWIVIRSRKEACFFVGADVHTIAAQTDATAAGEIVLRGQELMQQFESLDMNTLAFIEGTCLGGGLELALSCRYRIAVDTPTTKLGLPEIKLGLIPGWGGTQRLPRIVGLENALSMILKGNSLTASESKRVGLVHRLLTSGEWESQPMKVLSDMANVPAVAGNRSWLRRAFEQTSWGRDFIIQQARKQIRGLAQQYPALAFAIEAVARSGDHDGTAFERHAFVKLLGSETARNLLDLFLKRELAKKPSTWLDASVMEVTAVPSGATSQSPALPHLGIIGGGIMGAGIGALAAKQGFRVTIKEVDQHAATAAQERIEKSWNSSLQAGRMSLQAMHDAIGRLNLSTEWSALANCDLVVEAASEISEIKRAIFQEADQRLLPSALLCTNTSSLSVSELAESIQRKTCVAGLHFFNPVERMELVEIVRTQWTDQTTLSQLLSVVRGLGKFPVITSDTPGFLVNRILFPYLGEAVLVAIEGNCIEDVDQQLRGFGMPMGPFELLDQVGIDVAYHVATSLPSNDPSSVRVVGQLGKMVSEGWLGKKKQLGFYDYSSRSKSVNSSLNFKPLFVKKLPDFQRDGLTDVQRRLIYPMLNEAARCLDEQVVKAAWIVDLAMVLGTGFSPHRGGPLHTIDEIGAACVCHNLQALERTLGRRFRTATCLANPHRADRRFFDSHPWHVEEDGDINLPSIQSLHFPALYPLST